MQSTWTSFRSFHITIFYYKFKQVYHAEHPFLVTLPYYLLSSWVVLKCSPALSSWVSWEVWILRWWESLCDSNHHSRVQWNSLWNSLENHLCSLLLSSSEAFSNNPNLLKLLLLFLATKNIREVIVILKDQRNNPFWRAAASQKGLFLWSFSMMSQVFL